MNPIMNNTLNITSVSDPWVESGAMVYVALTVATLSAVIMCCTWFVKQRVNKSDYGTVNVSEEEEEEEDIPLVAEEDSTAFTLDDSSADEGSSEEEVNSHEDAV